MWIAGLFAEYSTWLDMPFKYSKVCELLPKEAMDMPLGGQWIWHWADEFNKNVSFSETSERSAEAHFPGEV